MPYRPSISRLVAAVVPLLLLGGCAVPGMPGKASTAKTEAPAQAQGPAETAVRREAAQPDPEIPPAIATRYSQAVFLLESGDQTGAEAELKRFVADFQQYPGQYTNLAIIYDAQGRDDEASAALEQALAIDPDNAPALNQLGIVHRKNGRFAEAEAAYMKAVTVNPDYALAHLNLGILNDLYLGRLEQALTSYQSYQELNAAEDPQVAKWIADISRRVGSQ